MITYTGVRKKKENDYGSNFMVVHYWCTACWFFDASDRAKQECKKTA